MEDFARWLDEQSEYDDEDVLHLEDIEKAVEMAGEPIYPHRMLKAKVEKPAKVVKKAKPNPHYPKWVEQMEKTYRNFGEGSFSTTWRYYPSKKMGDRNFNFDRIPNKCGRNGVACFGGASQTWLDSEAHYGVTPNRFVYKVRFNPWPYDQPVNEYSPWWKRLYFPTMEVRTEYVTNLLESGLIEYFVGGKKKGVQRFLETGEAVWDISNWDEPKMYWHFSLLRLLDEFPQAVYIFNILYKKCKDPYIAMTATYGYANGGHGHGAMESGKIELLYQYGDPTKGPRPLWDYEKVGIWACKLYKFINERKIEYPMGKRPKKYYMTSWHGQYTINIQKVDKDKIRKRCRTLRQMISTNVGRLMK